MRLEKSIQDFGECIKLYFRITKHNRKLYQEYTRWLEKNK